MKQHEVHRLYRIAISAYYDGVKQTLQEMPTALHGDIKIFSEEAVYNVLDQAKTAFDKKFS